MPHSNSAVLLWVNVQRNVTEIRMDSLRRARKQFDDEIAVAGLGECSDNESVDSGAQVVSSDDESDVDEKFRSITPEEQEIIRKASEEGLSVCVGESRRIFQFDKDEVSRSVANGWLSDNFIDCYLSVINQRNDIRFGLSRCPSSKTQKKFHIFSVFFLQKLVQKVALNANLKSAHEQVQNYKTVYDYHSVHRWLLRAKKRIVDISLFMFPVRINGNHWVLYTADKDEESFTFYDPTGFERGNQARETVSYISSGSRMSTRSRAGRLLRI